MFRTMRKEKNVMTLDDELRDLARYLKDADGDSAAALVERARERIAHLDTAPEAPWYVRANWAEGGCPLALDSAAPNTGDAQ
jgi:hypothetical protein